MWPRGRPPPKREREGTSTSSLGMGRSERAICSSCWNLERSRPTGQRKKIEKGPNKSSIQCIRHGVVPGKWNAGSSFSIELNLNTEF